MRMRVKMSHLRERASEMEIERFQCKQKQQHQLQNDSAADPRASPECDRQGSILAASSLVSSGSRNLTPVVTQGQERRWPGKVETSAERRENEQRDRRRYISNSAAVSDTRCGAGGTFLTRDGMRESQKLKLEDDEEETSSNFDPAQTRLADQREREQQPVDQKQELENMTPPVTNATSKTANRYSRLEINQQNHNHHHQRQRQRQHHHHHHHSIKSSRSRKSDKQQADSQDTFIRSNKTATTSLLCPEAAAWRNSKPLPLLLILLMIMHQLVAVAKISVEAAAAAVQDTSAATTTPSLATRTHSIEEQQTIDYPNHNEQPSARDQTIIGSEYFNEHGDDLQEGSSSSSAQRKRSTHLTEADLLRSWNVAAIDEIEFEKEKEKEKLSNGIEQQHQQLQQVLDKLMNDELIESSNLDTSFVSADDGNHPRTIQKRSQQQQLLNQRKLLGALTGVDCNGKCQDLNAVWNLIRTMYPALANHLLALASIGRRHVTRHLQVVGGQATQIPRLLDEAEQAARLGYHGNRGTWLARVAANPVYARIVQDLQSQLRRRNQQQNKTSQPNAAATETTPKDTRVYGRVIHFPHEAGASNAATKTLDKLRQLNQQAGLSKNLEKVNEIDRSPVAGAAQQNLDNELENNKIPLVAGDGWPSGARHHNPHLSSDSSQQMATPRGKFVYGSVHLRPLQHNFDSTSPGKTSAGLVLNSLRQLQQASGHYNAEPAPDSYGRIITSPARDHVSQSTLSKLRQQLDEQQAIAAASDLLSKVDMPGAVDGYMRESDDSRYVDREGTINEMTTAANSRDEFVID